jgi:probable F420-dependent oxidoreductase
MSKLERPVRIGVQIQPHHQSYAAMRDAWRYAESLGVDTLFGWDHLAPRFGNPDGNTFECWTVVAAMAEATERVEIGPLIAVNAYRLPAIHADMARTVDAVSGGRLILGLGAGGRKLDLAQAGLPYTSDRERLEQLDADIEIFVERFRTKKPLPVRGYIPILIGGIGEKITLRIAARHADIWNGQGDPETVARKNQVLDAWCDRLGRNPDEIERSVLLIRPHQTDLADDYLAAGLSHVIYSVRAPANDFGPVEKLLAWRATL